MQGGAGQGVHMPKPTPWAFLACFARLRPTLVCLPRRLHLSTFHARSRPAMHFPRSLCSLERHAHARETVSIDLFLGRSQRPPSQILALCVYNMLMVSTISKPRLHVADHVNRSSSSVHT